MPNHIDMECSKLRDNGLDKKEEPKLSFFTTKSNELIIQRLALVLALLL